MLEVDASFATRRGSQVVRQRFAKPSNAGSNPVLASIVSVGLDAAVRVGRAAGPRGVAQHDAKTTTTESSNRRAMRA